VILSAMFAATILLADTTPAAASAAQAAAPATPAKPAAADKPAKPRMICKTEAVTGSLFPKKTCYDPAELAQRREDERKNLEQMQNNLSMKGN
jgi:hypothetical protein